MKRGTKPKTDVTIPVAVVAAVVIWFAFDVSAAPYMAILAIVAIFWPKQKPRCCNRSRCDCD